MVKEAKTLEWRETDSVLEALILEASLIKSHKPRYNVDLKDDKSFNYVVITKEAFPRVLLVRGKDLPSEWPAEKRKAVFGPFPHGGQLQTALKMIRRIFPYRDTCEPCVPGGVPCKPCFNRQIGLCPGVCSGEITKEEYAQTIRHLTLFFQAKKKILLKELEREMKVAAKEERFEDAAALRGQLFALTHINDVALIKEEFKNPHGPSPVRVEAYDVAHLMGGAMVGVMVVTVNGHAEPAEYRKFKINSVSSSNDPAALKEVLSRRLGHSEWPLPKIIVVDGSTAQMNVAEAVLEEVGA
jgi:excinuclease UvrABC nuclease subunit